MRCEMKTWIGWNPSVGRSARTPASRRTDKALWDCVERLAQEVLVLRLQFESERRNTDRREEGSSFGDEGTEHW